MLFAPVVPIELRKDPQIKAAIRTVLAEESHRVRHIGYIIDQDWFGDWAVFFRVVLLDEAAEGTRLHEVSRRVRSRIMDEIDIPNLGMMPRFNFRTESEQAELNDPDWAPLPA